METLEIIGIVVALAAFLYFIKTRVDATKGTDSGTGGSKKSGQKK